MSTIQWRPEINALTTPQSYVPRHVPRAVLGNDDLAAELREQLVSGNQISLDDLFICHITFRTARATIKTQRERVKRRLKQTPSLSSACGQGKTFSQMTGCPSFLNAPD